MLDTESAGRHSPMADRVAPEAVDGQTLVHTDVAPHNFLIQGRV